MADRDEIKEKVKNLPLKPGVYIMLDKHGEVIYVGKAKVLKNRVSQYFINSAAHTPKTRSMVSQVNDFDIIVAASEFEALVLECSLIKRHRPKYNILLKDDKGYPFVRLSEDEYPRFSLANRRAKDGCKYYGPFASRSVTRSALDAISSALKLPTCSRKFPRDIGKERPCLELGMGRCAGWCLENRSREEYLERIAQAESILKGKTAEVTAELESRMLQASDELRFEAAAELRDRKRAIERLKNRQKALAAGMSDTDAVGWYRGAAKSCFAVLHYADGALADKDFNLLPQTVEDEDSEILSNLLKQYYVPKNTCPKRILLPMEVEDREELERLLSENCGSKVTISVPRRGDALAITQRACLNAREEAERVTTAEEKAGRLTALLQKTLGMQTPPRRIEAFDISNTVRGEMVGAMTVFVDCRPRGSEKRSFIIKNADVHDDYSAMREVLTRRYTHYKNGDKGFDILPDLILIDGGSVHAEVAVGVLRELELSVPVFGMVKDDRHRTRALSIPGGGEIDIKANQSIFALIGRIQEETHRCAITLQRRRREQSHTSGLDKIKGVGPKRRAELLKFFGSITNIKQAELDELCRAVPKNTAQAVFDHFHTEENK